MIVKRASTLLGACLSVALVAACAGSKPLPLVGAPSHPGTSAGVPAALAEPGDKLPITFKFTGAPQSFTVPKGVRRLHVIASGAAGGGGAGGPGGTTDAWIPVHSGEVLGIFVGGKGSAFNDCKGGAGGYNGGGFGGSPDPGNCTRAYLGGGGGGASDVRDGGEHAGLDKRLLVAGGGGGEAAANVGWWAGGAGGSPDGGIGESYHEGSRGRGGTQTAGGDAGHPHCNSPATPGLLGTGGKGGSSCVAHTDQNYSGGGGGGGYYGGGGGSGNDGHSFTYPYDGSGGGGSGFVVAGEIRVNRQALEEPNRGDGIIEIVSGR